jgi:predicted nucleotidyltransferase
MIDIDQIKNELVERLAPLGPDTIILFGSYAYGTPDEGSDIDLFLLMDDAKENVEAKALYSLRDLIKKYKVGFDILAGDKNVITARTDSFYRVDILQKGKVLYGK